MAVGSICFRRPTWDAPAGSAGKICLSARNGAAGRIACRSDAASVIISPSSATHFADDGRWFRSNLSVLAYFVGREECHVGFGFNIASSGFGAQDDAFSLRIRSWGVGDMGDSWLLVVVPKDGLKGIAPSVLRVHFTSWADNTGFYNRTDDKAGFSVNPFGGGEAKSVGGLEIPTGRLGYEFSRDYTRSPYVDITFGADGEVLDMKHVAGR